VVDFRWYHYSRYRYSVDFYPLMCPRGQLGGSCIFIQPSVVDIPASSRQQML